MIHFVSLLLFEHPFTTQVRAIFNKYARLCINLIYLHYLHYLKVIILFTFHILSIFLFLFLALIQVKANPLQATASVIVPGFKSICSKFLWDKGERV